MSFSFTPRGVGLVREALGGIDGVLAQFVMTASASPEARYGKAVGREAVDPSFGIAAVGGKTIPRKELQDLSNTVFATLRALLTDPKTTIAVRQRLALAYLARWQFADAQLDDWQSELPAQKATKGDRM